MSPIALAVLFLVPQGPRRVHLPSRQLPADRTFLALEVPDPRLLLRYRSRILQIGAFDLPRVGSFVRWALEADRIPDFDARSEKAGRILLGYDRGLTIASVFALGRRKKGLPDAPWSCMVGVATQGSRLRGHRALLLDILARDQGPVVEQRPVADSPVALRWVHRNPDWKVDWDAAPREEPVTQSRWIADSSVFDAYKGRTTAYLFQQGWTDRNAPRQILSLAGEILGLGGREAGPRLQPRPAALREGWTKLLGLRFRPKTLRRMIAGRAGNGMGPSTTLVEMVFGVHVVDEVTATLATDGDRIEERIELDLVPGQASVFTTLRPGGPGLFEAASRLPADTLAALHVRLEGRALSDLFLAFVSNGNLPEAELRQALGRARALLGLGAPSAETAGLEGLDEVVAFVVPGAAGSPVPEAGYLLPARGPDAADRVLETAAALLAEAGSKVDAAAAKGKIRTLGHGDDAVRYLRYADFFDLPETVAFSFLGGGFFTATTAGGWVLAGCNPRTVRRVRAAARGGKTLQDVPGFARAFPKGSGSPCEAFVDTAALAQGFRKYDRFVTSLYGWLGNRPPAVESPRLADLRPFLGRETFRFEKTDQGWVVVHEGGTLLSPSAWTAFGYGVYFVTVLEDIVTGG